MLSDERIREMAEDNEFHLTNDLNAMQQMAAELLDARRLNQRINDVLDGLESELGPFQDKGQQAEAMLLREDVAAHCERYGLVTRHE